MPRTWAEPSKGALSYVLYFLHSTGADGEGGNAAAGADARHLLLMRSFLVFFALSCVSYCSSAQTAFLQVRFICACLRNPVLDQTKWSHMRMSTGLCYKCTVCLTAWQPSVQFFSFFFAFEPYCGRGKAKRAQRVHCTSHLGSKKANLFSQSVEKRVVLLRLLVHQNRFKKLQTKLQHFLQIAVDCITSPASQSRKQSHKTSSR